MLTKRIIPCLDIKDGQTVKGINFLSLKAVGDPVELAAAYSAQGADELVFLDISATLEGPFTVGGGISTADDAAVLLKAGADKVSVNSGAVKNPSLISEMASRFGSQCVVVAIDAKKVGREWRVTTHGGSRFSDKELFSWAKQAERLGAGEILFTSMDHDGTCNGYACEEYRRLSSILGIPVIASGGAGNAEHIAEVLSNDGGCADAALAASIFHYGEVRIPDLKRLLAERNIPVRP